jgi:hypothetical protein
VAPDGVAHKKSEDRELAIPGVTHNDLRFAASLYVECLLKRAHGNYAGCSSVNLKGRPC